MKATLNPVIKKKLFAIFWL